MRTTARGGGDWRGGAPQGINARLAPDGIRAEHPRGLGSRELRGAVRMRPVGRHLFLQLQCLLQQDDHRIIQRATIAVRALYKVEMQLRRQPEPQVLDLARLLDRSHGHRVGICQRAGQATMHLDGLHGACYTRTNLWSTQLRALCV